jgi:hypothetical protein
LVDFSREVLIDESDALAHTIMSRIVVESFDWLAASFFPVRSSLEYIPGEGKEDDEEGDEKDDRRF